MLVAAFCRLPDRFLAGFRRVLDPRLVGFWSCSADFEADLATAQQIVDLLHVDLDVAQPHVILDVRWSGADLGS